MPLLLLRFWKEGVIGLLVIALGITWMIAKANDRRADKWQERNAQTQAAFDQTVTNYRQAREQARLADLAHKAEVEAIQEKERADHEAQIQHLRTDFAQRVRVYAKANPGGIRSPSMPGAPNSASEPASAGGTAVVPIADLNICAVNTAAAEGWLAWWREVSAIPR